MKRNQYNFNNNIILKILEYKYKGERNGTKKSNGFSYTGKF